MSLDYTPNPAASRFWTMVLAQARIEFTLLIRNAEQMLLALVIPLILLVMGTRAASIVDLGPGRSINIIAPGVLALAVLSTSFTSLAIATGFERRYGVLKRLGATPLPRSGLVVGKVCAIVLLECVQLLVLSLVAGALGWQPQGGLTAWLWALALVVMATTAFAALGLLIAGALRAEATLAAANLIYVVLLVGGGIIVPLDRYPSAVRPVLELLPSGAFGEGLRDVFAGAPLGWLPIMVLAVWAVIAIAVVTRTFKWE